MALLYKKHETTQGNTKWKGYGLFYKCPNDGVEYFTGLLFKKEAEAKEAVELLAPRFGTTKTALELGQDFCLQNILREFWPQAFGGYNYHCPNGESGLYNEDGTVKS